MLSIYKPQITKRLEKFLDLFLVFHPDLLTVLSCVTSIIFFASMLNGNILLSLFVFPFVFLDFLDGYVARKTKKTSRYGAFLDSTLDRISDAFIIAAFAFSGLVGWRTVTLLIFLSMLISYTRSRAELAAGHKITFNVGFIERTERLVSIYAMLLLYAVSPEYRIMGYSILEAGFFVLTILSIFTVIQRMSRARFILKKF